MQNLCASDLLSVGGLQGLTATTAGDGTDVTTNEPADDGLRIHEVSERLGIPAPTLRSWERRYGLPTTTRSVGGHRRYSAEALIDLRLMRDEIARGRGAASAARSVNAMRDGNNPAMERVNQMLDAVSRSDPAGVAAALEQSRIDLGLAVTIDQVLMPSMRQIGDWWEDGRCDVAQERRATAATRAWLARLVMQATPPADMAPVILACGPRDLHTVGLDALAALLAEQGCRGRVLGPPTTQDRLLSAIAATSASAVVVVSHLATQRRPAVEVLQAVAGTGCEVFYAGNAFAYPTSREGVPGTYLGESLSMAAAMILQAVGSGGLPRGGDPLLPVVG